MTALDSRSFNRADSTLGVKPGRVSSKSWNRRVPNRNRSRRIRMAQRSPMISSVRATGHLREYFRDTPSVAAAGGRDDAVHSQIFFHLPVFVEGVNGREGQSKYPRNLVATGTGDHIEGVFSRKGGGRMVARR